MATAVSATVSAQAISAQASVEADNPVDSSSACANRTIAAPWKRLSVGQFLHRVNWENKPASAIASEQTPTAAPRPVQEFTYRLKVGQFFGAIPWDGSPMAQDIASETSPELPVGEVTLPGETVELPDLDEFADGAADAGEDITLDDFFGAFSDM